jgi:type VI secretion system protein ImpB
VPNTLTGEGNLQVDITFESMDDFSPAAIAKKVEPLRQLLETRTQLANLMTFMDGKSGAEDLIGKMLADPGLLAALGSAPNPAASRPSPSAPAAAAEPSNGPADEAPAAAIETEVTTSDTESTDSSGKEGEGQDDLDSLLDQLN